MFDKDDLYSIRPLRFLDYYLAYDYSQDKFSIIAKKLISNNYDKDFAIDKNFTIYKKNSYYLLSVNNVYLCHDQKLKTIYSCSDKNSKAARWNFGWYFSDNFRIKPVHYNNDKTDENELCLYVDDQKKIKYGDFGKQEQSQRNLFKIITIYDELGEKTNSNDTNEIEKDSSDSPEINIHQDSLLDKNSKSPESSASDIYNKLYTIPNAKILSYISNEFGFEEGSSSYTSIDKILKNFQSMNSSQTRTLLHDIPELEVYITGTMSLESEYRLLEDPIKAIILKKLSSEDTYELLLNHNELSSVIENITSVGEFKTLTKAKAKRYLMHNLDSATSKSILLSSSKTETLLKNLIFSSSEDSFLEKDVMICLVDNLNSENAEEILIDETFINTLKINLSVENEQFVIQAIKAKVNKNANYEEKTETSSKSTESYYSFAELFENLNEEDSQEVMKEIKRIEEEFFSQKKSVFYTYSITYIKKITHLIENYSKIEAKLFLSNKIEILNLYKELSPNAARKVLEIIKMKSENKFVNQETLNEIEKIEIYEFNTSGREDYKSTNFQSNEERAYETRNFSEEHNSESFFESSVSHFSYKKILEELNITDAREVMKEINHKEEKFESNRNSSHYTYSITYIKKITHMIENFSKIEAKSFLSNKIEILNLFNELSPRGAHKALEIIRMKFESKFVVQETLNEIEKIEKAEFLNSGQKAFESTNFTINEARANETSNFFENKSSESFYESSVSHFSYKKILEELTFTDAQEVMKEINHKEEEFKSNRESSYYTYSITYIKKITHMIENFSKIEAKSFLSNKIEILNLFNELSPKGAHEALEIIKIKSEGEVVDQKTINKIKYIEKEEFNTLSHKEYNSTNFKSSLEAEKTHSNSFKMEESEKSNKNSVSHFSEATLLEELNTSDAEEVKEVIKMKEEEFEKHKSSNESSHSMSNTKNVIHMVENLDEKEANYFLKDKNEIIYLYNELSPKGANEALEIIKMKSEGEVVDQKTINMIEKIEISENNIKEHQEKGPTKFHSNGNINKNNSTEKMTTGHESRNKSSVSHFSDSKLLEDLKPEVKQEVIEDIRHKEEEFENHLETEPSSQIIEKSENVTTMIENLDEKKAKEFLSDKDEIEDLYSDLSPEGAHEALEIIKIKSEGKNVEKEKIDEIKEIEKSNIQLGRYKGESITKNVSDAASTGKFSNEFETKKKHNNHNMPLKKGSVSNLTTSLNLRRFEKNESIETRRNSENNINQKGVNLLTGSSMKNSNKDIHQLHKFIRLNSKISTPGLQHHKYKLHEYLKTEKKKMLEYKKKRAEIHMKEINEKKKLGKFYNKIGEYRGVSVLMPNEDKIKEKENEYKIANEALFDEMYGKRSNNIFANDSFNIKKSTCDFNFGLENRNLDLLTQKNLYDSILSEQYLKSTNYKANENYTSENLSKYDTYTDSRISHVLPLSQFFTPNQESFCYNRVNMIN